MSEAVEVGSSLVMNSLTVFGIEHVVVAWSVLFRRGNSPRSPGEVSWVGRGSDLVFTRRRRGLRHIRCRRVVWHFALASAVLVYVPTCPPTCRVTLERFAVATIVVIARVGRIVEDKLPSAFRHFVVRVRDARRPSPQYILHADRSHRLLSGPPSVGRHAPAGGRRDLPLHVGQRDFGLVARFVRDEQLRHRRLSRSANTEGRKLVFEHDSQVVDVRVVGGRDIHQNLFVLMLRCQRLAIQENGPNLGIDG